MTPPPLELHPRLSASAGTIPHRIALTVLVAATIAVAAGMFAAGGAGWPSPDVWFWAGVCVAGELLWVRLPLDRSTLSMAACFQFAAALCASRTDAMLATAMSVVIAELVFVRKPWQRAAYNAAQCAIAVAAAQWVLRSLAGPVPIAQMFAGAQLLPVVAAAAAYYAINRGAVTFAVALSRDLRIDLAWRENFGGCFDPIGCSAVLALGALVAVSRQQLGMAVTLLALLPLHLVCRSYHREIGSRVLPADSREVRNAA